MVLFGQLTAKDVSEGYGHVPLLAEATVILDGQDQRVTETMHHHHTHTPVTSAKTQPVELCEPKQRGTNRTRIRILRKFENLAQ